MSTDVRSQLLPSDLLEVRLAANDGMVSPLSISLPTLALLSGVVAVALYSLWRLALPKPYPGIPYNKKSTNRILGDVPDLVKHIAKTKEVISWIANQNERLGSPVVQVFLRPFSKPWVVISDFRESQDILVRRTDEFDRSDFFGGLFRSITPGFQAHMKTDKDFWAHRKLMNDTMSTSFLQNVAAPQVYRSAQDLLQLWREKLRLALDHPMEASRDLHMQALDAIWAPAFGTHIGTTASQAAFLAGQLSIPLSASVDEIAILPEAPTPDSFKSLITLSDSFSIPSQSAFPTLAHSFALNFYPYLRRARAHKDALIKSSLVAAWSKFSSTKSNETQDASQVKSALDLIVQREILLAHKESRKPNIDTQTIRDELFGFMLAGHDTTATTLSWAVKYLTTDQSVQNTLRQALKKALPRAAEAGTLPEPEELIAAHCPYFDAVLEESLRCANVGSAVIRTAKRDTTVLGHAVPKGTDVFMINAGAGFIRPPVVVDEEKRHVSSRANKGKFGDWDPATLHLFDPERWLEHEGGEKGEGVFNPRAGPFLAFGAGPRGCFGKKLAYVQLRLMLGLLIWEFELLPVPEKLAAMEAVDVLTHKPQKCYVRLRGVGSLKTEA